MGDESIGFWLGERLDCAPRVSEEGGAARRAAGVGRCTGEGNHQDVTTGRQHDHTEVGYDRRETIFQFAGLQIGMELPKRLHRKTSWCRTPGAVTDETDLRPSAETH